MPSVRLLHTDLYPVISQSANNDTVLAQTRTTEAFSESLSVGWIGRQTETCVRFQYCSQTWLTTGLILVFISFSLNSHHLFYAGALDSSVHI